MEIASAVDASTLYAPGRSGLNLHRDFISRGEAACISPALTSDRLPSSRLPRQDQADEAYSCQRTDCKTNGIICPTLR